MTNHRIRTAILNEQQPHHFGRRFDHVKHVLTSDVSVRIMRTNKRAGLNKHAVLDMYATHLEIWNV